MALTKRGQQRAGMEGAGPAFVTPGGLSGLSLAGGVGGINGHRVTMPPFIRGPVLLLQ